MADDIACVLDACGITQAHIVGISMGGMIAQEFALRHPTRTRKLVLIATTPGLPHGKLPPLRTLGQLLRLPLIRDPRRAGLAIKRLLVPDGGRIARPQLFGQWQEEVRQNPVEPLAFAAQFIACALHSTGRRLHRITCETVVVTGEADCLIPADNSRRIAARIPGAKLEILPGVGHGAPIQDPDIVALALRD
jgi:3-oxoadipate enol-lactonase